MSDPSHSLSDADLEKLLAQRGWVQRLAQSLVADSSLADDVAQASWLAALRRPPRHAQNLRSWLSTLVRNTARSMRRGEARRARRETEAVRDRDATDTTDALERAELVRELVTTVLALREPYKSAMVLVYFEGLAPSDVAERLGLPASTVRTQIQRGLALVKSELEKKRGREHWLPALVVLARKPAVPVAAAGVVLMSLKIKAALAAIVLACLGLWSWRHFAAVEPEPSVAAAPVLPETRLESKPIAIVEPAGEVRSAIGGQSTRGIPAESNEGSLCVEVVREIDGSPAPEIGVLLRLPDACGRVELCEGVSDAHGIALFEHVRPGSVHISLDRGREQHADVKPGERTDVRITIPIGVDVRGLVVDPDGAPVAGASIWLMYGYNWEPGRPVATSDGDGCFAIGGVSSKQACARKDGFAPSFVHTISGRPGDTVEITFVLRGRGASVDGVVLDLEGRPIEGARVSIHENAGYVGELPDGSIGAPPAARQVKSDAAGRFHAEDVATGSLMCDAEAHGFASYGHGVHARQGETARVEIRLGRGGVLRGRVLDDGGLPIAGVELFLPRGPAWSRSDGLGEFRIDRLGPGIWHALADGKSRGRANASIEIRDGEEAVWEAKLDKGIQLSGRLVDENDRPLEGWHVWVQPNRRRFNSDDELRESMNWNLDFGRTKTDADGRFALCNLLASNVQLEVRRPREAGSHPVVILDDVEPGRDDLIVRVRDENAPTGFVRGLVTSVDGKPVGDAEVLVGMVPSLMSGSVSGESSDRETGQFRIGPLPPGTYRLEVHARGFIEPDLGAFDLARGDEHDFGTIRLERGGSVCVKLKRSDGGAIGAPRLQLHREGKYASDLILLGDRARQERLPAGHYRLYVFEADSSTIGPPKAEIDVSTGKETTLEVELGPAPK